MIKLRFFSIVIKRGQTVHRSEVIDKQGKRQDRETENPIRIYIKGQTETNKNTQDGQKVCNITKIQFFNKNFKTHR